MMPFKKFAQLIDEIINEDNNLITEAKRLNIEESGFKSFNTIAVTIYTHYPNIVNFFNNRSTNASAESFNAKIKGFRATLRGVSDIKFFIYRVAKIWG